MAEINRSTTFHDASFYFCWCQIEDSLSDPPLDGLCPNLKARHQLAKKLEEKPLVMRKYQKEEALKSVLFFPVMEKIEPCIYNSELLPSRVLMLNQIMDALKDPSLNMIGICGVGGVGKTRLANEVCALARKGGLFDFVVLISVSRSPNLRRIQTEIAVILGLELTAEEVLNRASQLYHRLREDKTLIILDDVWQKLDLHTVGIPFGDECQGCKLLVSSRRKDVLSREMGTQEDLLVDVLGEEESWRLFQSITHYPGDQIWHSLSIDIIKRCAGVPLLINLVSAQLTDRALGVWYAMLDRLSMLWNADYCERVHRIVESIFENMPGENFKSLFLLCASFPRSNIQVQHLLINSMGLGLFSYGATIGVARNQLFGMIHTLKCWCLLLDGDLDGHVKMHDVVRDAAISIAYRYQNSFMGASETMLKDWLNKDCTGISLQVQSGQNLPARLQCPKAESFQLSSENLCLEIPNSFFEGAAQLKVIGFNGIRFVKKLPLSLGCLRNLRTLCFHRCRLDNISVIGELTELEFLSFADTNIVELPREVELLTQLKLLDLTNCSKLQVIPKHVISKLFALKELYMLNSYVRWADEGNASLEELENLLCLSSLEIQIVNPKLIPKFSILYNLCYYKIIVGEEQGWWGSYETSRTLKLIKLEASIHMKNAFQALLRGIENLYLDQVRGLGSVLDDLNGKGFPRLRHLCIKNDFGIQYLIKMEAGCSYTAFPLLESLCLDDLNSLEMICGKLKSRYSLWSSKGVEETNDIVSEVSEDNVFPHLSFLKMKNLPRFKGFGKRKDRTAEAELPFHDTSFEASKNLLNEIVTVYDLDGYRFPQLMHLHIESGCGIQVTLYLKDLNGLESVYFHGRSLNACNCNKLKILLLYSSTKCSMPLLELEVKSCHNMEAIFGESSEEEILELTQLRSLKLENLPNLIGFCKLKDGAGLTELLFNDMVFFPNLTSLVVEKCHSLKYVFTTSMVKCLEQLKKLEICNCKLVKAIIQSNRIGENEEEITNTIVFRKLDSLLLYGLPNVKVFGSRCEIAFPFLREVSIECPTMETFVSKFSDENNNCSSGDEYLFNELVTFSSLESLVVRNMNTFKYLWHERLILDSLFFKLKFLDIEKCSRLSAVFPTNALCSSEKVIEFPELSSLKLKSLPHLSGFGSKEEQGFGEQVSFPSLKSLELCECSNFKYVFTVEMVNCLMQLEKLEISNCELVEEILLSRQFHEIDDVEGFKKIVFPKLENLSLKKLPNLKTFDFGHPVEFQSLQELSISYCPALENFISKSLGAVGDEYFFNEMVTLSNLERMKVSHNYSSNCLWDGKFTADDSFLKLKSLSIEYCSKLSVVFPSNIYRRFQRLETLNVCCCSRVEEIYQFEEKNFEESKTAEPFYLKDVELWNLPSLKYIWSINPHGASTFEYLQSVQVFSCKDLLFLFPKSIARRLYQLQHLKIGESHMEVIIARTNVEESNFVFPQLAVLQLENLYEMRNLFNEPYTFDCPKLKQLDMHGCNQAMNFRSEVKSLQQCGLDQVTKLDSEMSAYHGENSLSFVTKEFIRDLEELVLDDQGLKLILSVEFSKLKKVTLRSLEKESMHLLISFLKRCSLEKLLLVENYLEEIFPVDVADNIRTLRIEHLEVVGDDKLKHILKEETKFSFILEGLLTLNVEFCDSLISIAPSAASFERLTSLNVSLCFKMKNLVTMSTVLSMKNLMELKVSECPMMECIVEDDENFELSISLVKLKSVELHDLPTLNSFSPYNNYLFNFPSLERVCVKKCFAMKNFCGGDVSTPKLVAIQIQDEQHWRGEINATIASRATSRV